MTTPNHPQAPCENCGSERWLHGNPGEDTAGLLIAAADGELFDNPAGIRVHNCRLFICRDCGNVRLIHIKTHDARWGIPA